MRTVRVASRQSALAMTQTNWVIRQLQTKKPDWTFVVCPVVTKGDRILDVTLSKVGGKGLFVSEIESAIQSMEADFAVHSLKDVPAMLADGLTLAGFPLREDPRDAFISRDESTFATLRSGARVGTSSLRRIAQLQKARPDLLFASVRGNIDTRLRKLSEGEFDAIVLAAAGLLRMGWADKITEYLSWQVCLPAIGQGILGVECRADDKELIEVLHSLNDRATKFAAEAERTLLARLNGSCQVPIAGYSTPSSDGQSYGLIGLVASPSGDTILRSERQGTDAALLGEAVADELLAQGAGKLLSSEG